MCTMLSNIRSVCMKDIYVYVVGVRFNQSSYTVNENSLEVQPVVVLSRPLSVSITIQVNDVASAATSKL